MSDDPWKNEGESMEMINAGDLVQNPDMKIEGRYRTLYDKRKTGWPWKNFEMALNIMVDRGWVPRTMAISDLGGEICVIMEKLPSDTDKEGDLGANQQRVRKG
jgi:hypothetical protein